MVLILISLHSRYFNDRDNHISSSKKSLSLIFIALNYELFNVVISYYICVYMVYANNSNL